MANRLSMPDDDAKENFLNIVNSKADVELRLSDFEPVSQIRAEQHQVDKPRFPAIDFHNHLDAMTPEEVLVVMDECGIEQILNMPMTTARKAIEAIDRFHAADRSRFHSIAFMDWAGVERPDFIPKTLDWLKELVDHGACGIKFWKDFGLTVRDATGELVRIDDERYVPIFERAGELGLIVMFHTSDPAAFYLPIDKYNERYEELAAHPDWAFNDVPLGKWELLEQRNTIFGRHPSTTFVGAHVGESGEDLGFVRRMLQKYPNVSLDISARVSELGRQPYTARQLFLDFPDRLIFGTDLPPEKSMYSLYFRFLETADEYFPYPSHASRQGRWEVHGLYLPDDVLKRVYRDNALTLLRR